MEVAPHLGCRCVVDAALFGGLGRTEFVDGEIGLADSPLDRLFHTLIVDRDEYDEKYHHGGGDDVGRDDELSCFHIMCVVVCLCVPIECFE